MGNTESILAPMAGEEAIVHERIASVTSAGEGETAAKFVKDVRAIRRKDDKFETGKFLVSEPRQEFSLRGRELERGVDSSFCNSERTPLSRISNAHKSSQRTATSSLGEVVSSIQSNPSPTLVPLAEAREQLLPTPLWGEGKLIKVTNENSSNLRHSEALQSRKNLAYLLYNTSKLKGIHMKNLTKTDHASSPLGIFASKYDVGIAMPTYFNLTETVFSRFTSHFSLPKSAFTLAEVLITLGIIGVVAALTLPTLIQGYKKQEASTRLKKFYSTMTQAIATAEADSGTKAYDWDALLWPTYDPANSYKLTSVYYNKYIAPYIKTLKVEDGVYDPKNNINSKMKIYFSDGSTAELNDGLCVDVYYDINGPKEPNQTGKDIFLFYIATAKSHANNRQHELYQNQSFSVGYLPLYNTETKALNACKTNASFCATFLMYHNFEFPKNYPYRL